MRTFVVSCLVGLALGGCANSGPPLPTYDDAFKGLYNQSSTTVPADVPVRVQHPVGIILSDNVEAYIAWLKKTDEYMHVVIPESLINTVGEADANPNYIAAQFLAMLKRHFPEAQVVKDFNEAVGSGKKAVCLLDIQAVVRGTTGQTTTVDATLYVFDASMNPVSKLSGHGEGVIPFPATTAQVQPSTDAAVRQLDAKITALVR
jgi:small nuclear ribonucleoprotein (snRNP)-like protein